MATTRITLHDHPRLAEAESTLVKLRARLDAVRARQVTVERERETTQAEAAELEVAAALHEDTRPDANIKRLRAVLRSLDDEASELARTEAVLGKATGDASKSLTFLREEAARPVAVSGVTQWLELLERLAAFAAGDGAAAASRAFVLAAQARDLPLSREDLAWYARAEELGTMKTRTQHVITVLRAAGYDV